MQLFQNMIANAIKFRKKDALSIVSISVEIKKDFAIFSIQDNGIGIAKSDCGKVFQLFTKLHTREEYRGSGIGLALCKRIVEQHKGHIDITSTLGVGTCISFSLPLHKKAAFLASYKNPV